MKGHDGMQSRHLLHREPYKHQSDKTKSTKTTSTKREKKKTGAMMQKELKRTRAPSHYGMKNALNLKI